MQNTLARAEVDPAGTADVLAASLTRHWEEERLHQMRLAASLGTGAARAVPQEDQITPIYAYTRMYVVYLSLSLSLSLSLFLYIYIYIYIYICIEIDR